MRTIPLGRRSVVITWMLVTMAMPARALDCALPDEYRALTARVLQTRMMVSALACDTEADYNTAVRRLRPALIEQGIALHRYFVRSSGRHGDSRLDQFVTRLANEESSRSTVDHLAYCKKAGILLRQLNGIATAQFSEMLNDTGLASLHEVGLCGHNAPGYQAVADSALKTMRHSPTPSAGADMSRSPMSASAPEPPALVSPALTRR